MQTQSLIQIDVETLRRNLHALRPHVEQLTEDWRGLAGSVASTQSPEVQKVLVQLQFDALFRLAEGDRIEDFYEFVGTTGRRFAQRQFPFEALVHSLHFFESICFRLLQDLHAGAPGELEDAVVNLDSVNHNVFAIIASHYFDEMNLKLQEKSRELERTNSSLTQLADELRWKNLQLQELLSTDSLTGLYNHRYFYERLEEEFYRAKRYGHSLSCGLLDIDGFKRYNDLYGHRVGDYVLEESALLLRGEVRTSDVVARYGGDEFSVILPETDKEQARMLVERLRQTVMEHKFKHDQVPDQTRITLSAGVVNYPDDVEDYLSFIPMADRALLQAKRLSRNRVCCLHSLSFKYDPGEQDGDISSLCIVGNFNGWNLGADAFRREGDAWKLDLLLPEGPVHYKFVINGSRWITDPRSGFCERDGLGGWNSVVFVGEKEPFGTRGDSAEGQVQEVLTNRAPETGGLPEQARQLGVVESAGEGTDRAGPPDGGENAPGAQ